MGVIFIWRDEASVGEILFEHVGDLFSEGGIVGEGGDFEVEGERAVIEISRADRGDIVVDEDDFLVHESFGVMVDFDSEGDSAREERHGGEFDHGVVDFFWFEDTDIDPAEGGSLE